MSISISLGGMMKNIKRTIVNIIITVICLLPSISVYAWVEYYFFFACYTDVGIPYPIAVNCAMHRLSVSQCQAIASRQ